MSTLVTRSHGVAISCAPNRCQQALGGAGSSHAERCKHTLADAAPEVLHESLSSHGYYAPDAPLDVPSRDICAGAPLGQHLRYRGLLIRPAYAPEFGTPDDFFRTDNPNRYRRRRAR